MAASAEQIAELRRKVAEPTTEAYSDSALAAYIERYAVTDSDGYEPDEADWTATYDLNAAAAEVWEEKASAVAADYTVIADGAVMTRSQRYEQYAKQAKRYRSRSRIRSIRIRREHPNESDVERESDALGG
jgi:hypothetical protein